MDGTEGFPYILSAHAARVLAEWVARVLAQPLWTESDRADPTVRHALARIPERGDRVLRVAYNASSEPWRIVTVYFDRSAGERR